MKKIGIIVFIAAVVVGVVVANIFSFGRVGKKIFNFSFFSSVSGSGNAASEKRVVSDFKSVEVGGIFQVEIVAQKDFSVEVDADDNLIPFIKTKIDDGVMKIETEKRINSHTPIRVRISAPDIESIEASGASKVSLAGVKNSEFKLETSGASKVTVEGETASLTVDVSGASKINAENLKAENAVVHASGATHVSVFVINQLRAEASGASKIFYAGSPKSAEKNSSGASSIREK